MSESKFMELRSMIGSWIDDEGKRKIALATLDELECPECYGTGNWTGWSGSDEHTQEGGCPACSGSGFRAVIEGRA